MLTLGNLLVLMVLASCAAWLWHSHGLRERALARVKQHCARLDIELLDDNVAVRKVGLVRDGSGKRRFARVYNFEFTVTGEHRYPATITLFGNHTTQIELAPYPFEAQEASPGKVIEQPSAAQSKTAEVIELDQWRQKHRKWRQ